MVEVPIQYKERIVERLVPVKIANDSLSIKALFRCDSLNNVVMKQLTEQKSKGVSSQFTFNAGQLKYKADAAHDTIYLPAKDSIIYKEVPIKVDVPVEVNKLTQWQIIQMWAGRVLLGLMLLYGIYTVIKSKLNLLK